MQRDHQGWLKSVFVLGMMLVSISMGGSWQSALAQQSVDMRAGQIPAAPSLQPAAPVNLALAPVLLSRPGNFTFPQGGSVLVPLTSTGRTESLEFTNSGNLTVQYTAECAVSAAAGNTTTWLNIDLELRNTVTGAVTVLSPTAGIGDALCTSNGTAGADGWSMNTIVGIHTSLPAGTYVARVRASVENGVAGNSGWLGDSTLTIRK